MKILTFIACAGFAMPCYAATASLPARAKIISYQEVLKECLYAQNPPAWCPDVNGCDYGGTIQGIARVTFMEVFNRRVEDKMANVLTSMEDILTITKRTGELEAENSCLKKEIERQQELLKTLMEKHYGVIAAEG